jgi:hypothetical protein
MSGARAWLEIMRISNAPTVVSNAIAGAVLGAVAIDQTSAVAMHDPRWIVVLAPLFSYLGGMVLNDAFDAATDARERPTRPIPSGRISRRAAFTVGAVLLLAGVGCAAASGSTAAIVFTGLLGVIVVLYNAIHSRTAASIALLAVCRALAAFIPMLVFANDFEKIATSGVLIHPTMLAGWTLALSFLARGEVAHVDGASRPCPSCGQPIVPNAVICSACGWTPNAAATTLHTTLRNHARAPIAIALVAGIVAAFVFMLPQVFMPPQVFMLPQGGVTFDRVSELQRALSASLVGALFAGFLVVQVRRHARGQIGTPAFVGFLIAMLAAIDVVALIAVGQWLAIACLACVAATLVFQRRIAGS